MGITRPVGPIQSVGSLPSRPTPPPITLGNATGLVVTIGGSNQEVIIPANVASNSGNDVWLPAIACMCSTKLPAVDGLNSGPQGSAGQGVRGQSDNAEGVFGWSGNGGAGVAGISNAPAASPQPGVWGESQNGEGVHGLSHGAAAGVFGQSIQSDGIHGVSSSNQPAPSDLSHSPGAGVVGINGNGGHGLWVQGGSTSADGKTVIPAAYFGVFSNGTLAARFDGDTQHNGNINVASSGDVILSDFAEHFDVVGCEEIAPGTVMTIDQHEALTPSRLPYDKRVAGIVAGAGEYRSAIVLEGRPSPQKRVPVALMGKACCKVDASYAPIEIGDLLTTSPTPGHAMKASDPVQAFGSVIGKALRPLQAGCELIPVLIALQ